MCNCLNESEKKITDHLKKSITSKGTAIYSVDEISSGYENKALVFSGAGGFALFMPFELRYTPIKKDGTIGKEKPNKVNIFPNYCPFCGIKIDKSE